MTMNEMGGGEGGNVCCASTPNRFLRNKRGEGGAHSRSAHTTDMVVATLSAICTGPASTAGCSVDDTESF